MASLIPASPLVLLLLVSTLASAVNGWVFVIWRCTLETPTKLSHYLEVMAKIDQNHSSCCSLIKGVKH